MSEKTYGVAGYSTLNGERKMRVAKDMKRAMVLERNGHKDIVLRELPYPMNKAQASEFLANGFVAEAPAATAQTALTFEQALAQVPVREKGRFIAKAVREQMARDLMAA
jgi:DNA gyrase/topoisomerase IV subunit A